MTTYARNVNGVLTDVIESNPFEIFHPNLAKEFIEVNDGALAGSVLVDGVWALPTEPAPTEDVAKKTATKK